MDILRKKTNVLLENLNTVISYQTPDIQRLLKLEHVEYLVNDQKEEFNKYNGFSMLQSITCVDYNDKRYILDGQHRVEAFKQLKKEGYELNINVPLVVYSVDSMDEMKMYYQRINKNNPINPLETSDEWQTFGKVFCVWLSNTYPEYIKNVDRTCNCPYINLREMMIYIKNKKVFERCKQQGITIELFIEMVLKLNDFLHMNNVNISKFQINGEIPKKIEKCRKKNSVNTLYLGIWRRYEWIELILYMMVHKKGTKDIDLSIFQNVRKKIPKSLKTLVWNKRNNMSLEGVCYVCTSDLNYDDMECGHIIPHVYDGGIEITNLEPICKTCNRDMGIMNLNEYKNLF